MRLTNKNITVLVVLGVVLALAIVFWPLKILPHYIPDYKHTALPDFSTIPAGSERKEAFSSYLVPLIQAVNAHQLLLRETAQQVATLPELSDYQQQWLAGLCQLYSIRTPCKPGIPLLQSIDSRINTVPVALALAQAAKESGWGTSRFARQGNNLFGQWCFSKGCGLVPLQRKPGAKHEVATFDSPAYSVDAYVRNINANGAYQLLRQHRQSLQNQAMPELVKALILGLGSYSERGQAYVHEVDAMIDNNPSWLAYPAVVEKHPPTL